MAEPCRLPTSSLRLGSLLHATTRSAPSSTTYLYSRAGLLRQAAKRTAHTNGSLSSGPSPAVRLGARL